MPRLNTQKDIIEQFISEDGKSYDNAKIKAEQNLKLFLNFHDKFIKACNAINISEEQGYKFLDILNEQE